MYLGLDFGTQSVKAVVVNENLEVEYEASVKFDTDLTEFRTSGGVNKDERDPKIVTASPLMWIKALDIVLEKLRLEGILFEKIKGVSGAAQQHGSVYWKRGARQTLQTMNPSRFLHEEFSFAFSVPYAPIWMDSSTTSYCTTLENAVGGPQNLSKITGSRAYERFTGSQISKIYHTKRDSYNLTERISLVSSFATSLFLGDYGNIDYSDASGMNLMDIRTKKWSNDICNILTGPDSELESKLGELVPTETVQGNVSGYFVERFGFSPECKVLSFTGDNPSSFSAMCLGSHDIAISLGTSDTVFLSLKNVPEDGFSEGHILANPLSSESDYMALLCFKNGSLTRERVKKNTAENSWSIFNQLLDSTPRGNFGNIGLYYDYQEILPKVKAGDYRFNKEGAKLLRFSGLEIEVRALIEGQFLARRVYAQRIGCKITKETRILATGGASQNPFILQVLSDVFNAPVYVQELVNSADMGACYRLKHALDGGDEDLSETIGAKNKFKLICEPSLDAASIYNAMAQRYEDIETQIIISSN